MLEQAARIHRPGLLALFRAELRVITGRRGFRAALLGPVLVVAAVGVVRVVLHALDPVAWPSIGGITAATLAGALAEFVIVVTAVVTGALAGCDGLTRRPPRAYLARVPALLLVVGTMVGLAAAALELLAALPHEFDAAVTTGWVLRQAWSALVPAAVYGLLSLAVGSLLGAPARAVAVSLLVSVAAAPVLLTVSVWSQRLGQLLLPGAVARLSHPGRAAASSLLLAAAVVVVWLAVPLAAGGLRLQRGALSTEL